MSLEIVVFWASLSGKRKDKGNSSATQQKELTKFWFALCVCVCAYEYIHISLCPVGMQFQLDIIGHNIYT